MKRFFCETGLLVLWFFPFVLGISAIDSAASDDDSLTRDERQHIQADRLRREAVEESRSKLGYEHLYQEPRDRKQDFATLSYQIQMLGALLQNFSEILADPAASGSAYIPYLPSATTGLPPMSPTPAMYGPEGPTEKSVRLILEYRLLVNGNPRLTVGKIKESSESVLVQVVTVDGSLVEEYSIDKKTGRWLAVLPDKK